MVGFEAVLGSMGHEEFHKNQKMSAVRKSVPVLCHMSPSRLGSHSPCLSCLPPTPLRGFTVAHDSSEASGGLWAVSCKAKKNLILGQEKKNRELLKLLPHLKEGSGFSW